MAGSLEKLRLIQKFKSGLVDNFVEDLKADGEEFVFYVNRDQYNDVSYYTDVRFYELKTLLERNPNLVVKDGIIVDKDQDNFELDAWNVRDFMEESESCVIFDKYSELFDDNNTDNSFCSDLADKFQLYDESYKIVKL